MHECVKEKEWGVQEEKNRGYDLHLQASDCRGGTRDRIADAERDIKELRKIGWIAWFCAFLGGLTGKALEAGLSGFFK